MDQLFAGLAMRQLFAGPAMRAGGLNAFNHKKNFAVSMQMNFDAPRFHSPMDRVVGGHDRLVGIVMGDGRVHEIPTKWESKLKFKA